ncbi:two-component sensor histidine kinase [Polaribacter sp. SA4-10]|uniref:sensor histidine kinase n=1 Tax=Polaribacter sp. SA4-10 TaxID=754397 RepID=UPI000B3C446B|nr:HAMP domain-containing sensor histidine kinase [Polaribacter sp. SA4-10]ARV07441.1 two-component sensor histidine kinase [Polaribacter sp. SA4-10]
MNIQKYQLLFHLITATIIATIGVQFYWNYKNYEENKRQLTNEIQLSLDNAIEEYYSTLAKEEITTIINFSNNNEDPSLGGSIRYDSIFKHSKKFQKFKSLIINKDTSLTKPKFEITNISFTSDDKNDAKKTDSIVQNFAKKISKNKKINIEDSKNKQDENYSEIKYFKGKKAADSLKLIKTLKPIFISITSNEIEYPQLDSLIKNQLDKKKIPITFVFNHLKNDTIFHSSNDSLIIRKLDKSVSSKSTYLKKGEEFKLFFNNTSLEALKRSSLGILLSLLLSLLIIGCLFYLLKIINHQKELAAIKNDLISNITHEFKTPIATISAAIEAIKDFNVLEDKEKTNKYLSISSIQINKLHQMVEKLLETAMLDSEQLVLKKETVDIVNILERLVSKHQILAYKKELSFSINLQPCYANVDVFHFENVISNLIDNAVKYGGDKIRINVISILNSIEITAADNGSGIEKNQQEKIFDKFYRVPKGNTQDIKGFGIGLYYCKKIIEKHGGIIILSSDKNQTIFKISIPNE